MKNEAKYKKHFIFLILLVNVIYFSFIFINNKSLFIKASSIYSSEEIWSPNSLYNYTKTYFLESNNPQKSYNLKHMIVDPENYLDSKDLSEIKKGMKILYDKFKINNYIFLISHIKIPSYKKKNMENFDMNSEVERFVSKFNYIMYRDNSFYEDNMTLTTIFFIKDRKMRMRTGHSLRNIIKDKDALNILNRRINDLREEKYYEVIYGLVNDVYKTYISNYELYNSFLYKNSNKIVYTIISIIIGIIFFWNIISYVPESERENKIKEFLNRNKDKKIKKIFNESCIICLEYFMPEEDKLKIENLFDKKKLKQEKTTFLECGHQFHERCIIEWLKTQNKCPLCRIKVKYENDKNKQNRESYINDNNDDERSRFLGFDNFFSVDDIVNDIVYIQRDAYPHQINERQGNRIINNYKEEKDCSKSGNDSGYDSGHDFDDFNDGSGGATSEW